jgi:hypothetical protein
MKIKKIKSELKNLNGQIQAVQQANQRIEAIRDNNAKRLSFREELASHGDDYRSRR